MSFSYDFSGIQNELEDLPPLVHLPPETECVAAVHKQQNVPASPKTDPNVEKKRRLPSGRKKNDGSTLSKPPSKRPKRKPITQKAFVRKPRRKRDTTEATASAADSGRPKRGKAPRIGDFACPQIFGKL